MRNRNHPYKNCAHTYSKVSGSLSKGCVLENKIKIGLISKDSLNPQIGLENDDFLMPIAFSPIFTGVDTSNTQKNGGRQFFSFAEDDELSGSDSDDELANEFANLSLSCKPPSSSPSISPTMPRKPNEMRLK